MTKTEELGRGASGSVMHACAYHIHVSDEEREQYPLPILKPTCTPFRRLRDAAVKVLAEMKGTHDLTDAVLRVVRLLTGSAPNGDFLIEGNLAEEVRLYTAAAPGCSCYPSTSDCLPASLLLRCPAVALQSGEQALPACGEH
jgi:hypothetical protein